MQNLLSLLAMLNATETMLAGKPAADASIARLVSETDTVVMGGCAYDCCNPPCESSEYSVCRAYIEMVTPPLLKEVAWCNINTMYTLNLESLSFFDNEMYFDLGTNEKMSECTWVDEMHQVLNISLSAADGLLAAAVRYHKNPYGPDAVANACFGNSPPRNYMRRHIRRAAQARDKVLRKRRDYLKADIAAILSEFNYKSKCMNEDGGSGYAAQLK